jgi:hypothetical protein
MGKKPGYARRMGPDPCQKADGITPFIERIPYQAIIQNSYVPETDYIVGTRGKNYVFVYIPTGWNAEINLLRCGWVRAKAWWYNPRNGEVTEIGTFQGRDIRTFTPPTKGRGNDWISGTGQCQNQFPSSGKEENSLIMWELMLTATR